MKYFSSANIEGWIMQKARELFLRINIDHFE